MAVTDNDKALIKRLREADDWYFDESWEREIAYPAEVLKPVPKKKCTATFYSSHHVDPKFYDTMLIVTDHWVKYAKDYDSIDDVKFPVGSYILEVVEGEAE